MSANSPVPPIRESVAISLPIERAFDRFLRGLHEWWPPEYTWSGDVLEEIRIEPREGGMCLERGPDGFRCDWGRVLELEPPGWLAFTWQIGPAREPVPDPRRASVVTVRFAKTEGTDTRVELEHARFERHGSGAAGYREALASDAGWPYILGRYAALNA